MSSLSCVVNGEPREVTEGDTVADLLEGIGLRMSGVAVAVDQHVVQPEQFADIAVIEGMHIEIVRAVGGG